MVFPRDFCCQRAGRCYEDALMMTAGIGHLSRTGRCIPSVSSAACQMIYLFNRTAIAHRWARSNLSLHGRQVLVGLGKGMRVSHVFHCSTVLPKSRFWIPHAPSLCLLRHQFSMLDFGKINVAVAVFSSRHYRMSPDRQFMS
jgi:hypothetical protein